MGSPEGNRKARTSWATAGLLGAGLTAALVLMLLGPGSWYGPVFVMAIAALLVWWVTTAADRARERELGELVEQIDRIAPGVAGRTSAPGDVQATLGGALRRLAELERRVASGLGERDEGIAGLRALIDAVDVPVIATDERGSVESMNRAAATMLGDERRAMVGRPLEEVLVQPELLTLVGRARSGQRARGRVRYVADEGARFYDVTAEPVPRAAEPGATPPVGVVITLLNVTELAAAVQLKTDFAANASHELRTPIAAIKAAADTMEAAEDDPEMTGRLRRMIVQHVARLEELVDDLLDLSRLEAAEGRPAAEPLAMSGLAGRLDELFAGPCSDRRLRLTFDLDPALERMEIDATLLELILRNLVDNAVKFARENTEVRVIGRASDVDPALESSDMYAPAEDAPELGARFRVVDKGQGIPLADQQRIFERFYQVDTSRDGGSRRRGTGLGLAIVKHALRRLGGRISVESVWQQGTTMTFEIPRCVRVGAPDDGAAAASPARAAADR